jgi:hypothetical protein
VATEAGAANIKSTLQPKPSPVEFNPFETIFVPFALSSFVKLSLHVGQPKALVAHSNQPDKKSGAKRKTFMR